jgi:hypothetical protein
MKDLEQDHSRNAARPHWPLALSALIFFTGCGSDEGGKQQSSTGPSGQADDFQVPVSSPKPPKPNEPTFTPSGGTFKGHQSVELDTSAGKSSIHYTLDGSTPDENSPEYESALELDKTTLIRALAFPDDGSASEASAAVYVALSDEAAKFTSNLPLLILERHGKRPLDGGDEFQDTSLLSFEPAANARTALLGTAVLTSRGAVHLHGETSRGFQQKSYALELRHAGDDEDREEVLLGMPSESDWVLVAPSDIDRSLMRTMLPMDLSRKIGSYAPRTRFAEVFVVDRERSDQLEMDDYVGVYCVTEKIKRNQNRVNVVKADPPSMGGDVSGGYIFRIDHGGADFNAAGQDFQWVYPDKDVMGQGDRKEQVDFLRDYLADFLSAARAQDFRSPDSGKRYSEYIDVPQFIDHNLLNALTKNVDGLRLSAYFHKDAKGLVAAGPVWDFDRSMGAPQDDRARNPEEWASGDGTKPLSELFWGDLFRDQDFADAYWSRWDELVKGPFSVSAVTKMIDDYEDQLAEARERHFDRWQSYRTDAGPAGEVDILRDWFARRIPWIDSQRP